MDKKISQSQIDLVKEMANEKIEFILDELNVNINELNFGNDEIRGCCPVHEGNNRTSFAYSIKRKSWRCYTNNCHDTHYGIFGLVQLLLEKIDGKKRNFYDALEWIASKLGINIGENEAHIDPAKEQIYKLVKEIQLKNSVKNNGIEKVKESHGFPFLTQKIDGLIEPSQYFLDQGFSYEILKKYNVGFCDEPKKPMYLRSFFPVLDDIGSNVIGVTGRIVYEKCDYCNEFHEQGRGCPVDNFAIKGHAKWFHYGFNTNSTLWNIWFAEKYIRDKKTIIITEGPKDVLWLEQHGVHNSVCLFGLNVLPPHLKKMVSMGFLKVIVALNNDEKGLNAMEKLETTIGNYFKLTNIKQFLDKDGDIADLSSERMNKELVPFLQKI